MPIDSNRELLAAMKSVQGGAVETRYLEFTCPGLTYREGADSFVNHECKIAFVFDENYSRIEIPELATGGYYGEYSSQWQEFEFDRAAGILSIHGRNGKRTGGPYDIKVYLRGNPPRLRRRG
jgi:hypothetical protein